MKASAQLEEAPGTWEYADLLRSYHLSRKNFMQDLETNLAKILPISRTISKLHPLAYEFPNLGRKLKESW